LETKRCATCQENLDVTEFAFKNKEKTRRSSWCKECSKKYKKKHYSKNKQKYITGAAVCNHKKRTQLRISLWESLENPQCKDCGEKDQVVLEFDHKNPEEKSDSIAKMIANNRPLAIILIEVAKCDIRCANCHRRRTAIQYHWFEEPSDIIREAKRKYRSSKKELEVHDPDL
jgi:hypothetical protein